MKRSRLIAAAWAIAVVAGVSCSARPSALAPAAGASAESGGSGTAGQPQAVAAQSGSGGTPSTGNDAGVGADGSRAGGSGGSGAAGDARMTSSSDAGSGGASGGAGAAGSGAAGSASEPRPNVTAASGTVLVKVNAAVRYQMFEGWGTSLCWWANHVGGWSPSARNAFVDALVDPTGGLGYNVFRYNIGGGENPAHSHMEARMKMPGLQAPDGTWTWDADAAQRAILQRVVERGQGVVLEAFSNSPPYWMTKSGCASGNTDGSNNLKEDAYDAFADYLTDVVLHYRDTFGITFRTLEPLNEPNANWWKANGRQEGCHFAPSNQQRIIQAVGAKLVAKALTGTSVSASDENSLDEAYNNIRTFDASTLVVLSQLNVHSYAGSRRTEVRELAASKGKRLWQSESGPLGQMISDDTDAAMFMAGRILTDLRELRPEAWVDWQVADPGRSWASFVLDDARQSFTPLKRFYMHAGFSRFIRPGARFVAIENGDMVAALSSDGSTLALVVRNAERTASKRFTFDLTALPRVGTSVEVYRTSRSEDLVTLPPIPIQGWSFVAEIPAYSITTFVVRG